nr:RDD family protein [Actinomycetota bacterium]
AQGPSGPRASFGRRLVAYLIDTILLGIVYVVFAAIFDETVGSGLSLLIGIAYFGYLEGGASGQTLGKKALGIRVIDFSSGGPIGYGRGVVRYLGRIVSGIVCLLGYLWMLWDKEKQTWHDKFATSVVVPVQYYRVS